MSGLENIIKEIDHKAELEAGQILAEAKEYCDDYLEQQKVAVANEVAEYEKKAEKERELFVSKSNSGGEFEERNAVLKAKQKNIDLALKNAYRKMAELSDQEYFEMLLKILKSNVVDKDGELLLGEKDAKRLPQDFADKVNQIAKECGGSLTISSEKADIANGFILRYGMIEENCTLQALMDTKMEHLKDIASRQLFG